jgi:hypothetical protein
MKILEIDWQDFIRASELYGCLPLGARRLFVEKAQPSQALPNAVLGEWREALLDSGLMFPGVKSMNAHVAPEYMGFCRVVRSLWRNRIFDRPSRDSFHDFVSEHLSGAEVSAFSGRAIGFYDYYDYEGSQRLYSRVCSADWVKQFLAASHPGWEQKYQVRGTRPYFPNGKVYTAAQALVRSLSRASAPLPMSQLQGMCPDLPPDLLASAIRAGIRYLLFFPALRDKDLEVTLGLWPGIAAKLTGAAPRPPAPVAVSESFHSPFLVEDMTAVLTACAIEPLRIRAGDFQIFESMREDLMSALGTLPEWVEREFGFAPPDRISMALAFLQQYEFLERKGRLGRDYRVEATESGLGWLSLGENERLKAVVDGLRGTLKKTSSLFEDEAVSLMPTEMEMASPAQNGKVASSMMACYAGLDADKPVRLREFLAYQGQMHNPLPALLRADRTSMLWVGGMMTSEASTEELEEAWEGVLADFLGLRLLPLGGVKLGKDSGGELCFALTEAGRYLLGAAQDFHLAEDAPGRVMVQPNFDVVFLASWRKAETELARFCERKGRHVGTLFKVTKQSIFAAAASGLTPERVLGSLREYCSAGLPPNVEFEITGWFGQYREISIRPALLIHCPDAETALRVAAVAGKKVTRLTETTLELPHGKAEAALRRKLREKGIFART